jgi:hypothetical protein
MQFLLLRIASVSTMNKTDSLMKGAPSHTSESSSTTNTIESVSEVIAISNGPIKSRLVLPRACNSRKPGSHSQSHN